MKYRLNNEIEILSDNKIRLFNMELEFDSSFQSFVERINDNTIDDNDEELLKKLLSSGVLIKEDLEWLPLHEEISFFNATIENLSEDILAGKETIGIIGVPYYAGTTATIGIEGVEILRRTSLRSNDSESLGTELKIKDYGNVPQRYLNIHSIQQLSSNVFESKIKPCFVGGDHSLTYSIICGYLNIFSEPITVLYFDSHSDLSERKCRLAHNNVFTWLSQQSEVQLVSFGNFSYLDKEEKEAIELNSLHISKKSELMEYLTKGKQKIYISFDFDCISTPAVSYPNGYGKPMEEIIEILEEISQIQHIEVFGADFVEYNCLYDTKNNFEALRASEIIIRLIKILDMR